MQMLKALLLSAIFLIIACQGSTGRNDDLQGTAEGLWNEEISLAEYNSGITILNPFSPSNCGWCFFDGDFIRDNYYRSALERGDAFFGMCLFNPQRDIYTFQKHYREQIPVITAPLSLHTKYHNDGFPWITVVKDGENLFEGDLEPYDFVFDSLSPIMWPNDPPPVRPTSPLQMADKFIDDNQHMEGIFVIADGDSADMRILEEGIQAVKRRYNDRGQEFHQSFEMKYESDLSESDLTKNIELKDKGGRLRFDILKNQDIPVRISDKTISIGEFSFARDDIFAVACFPSPYDPEKFIKVSCVGRNVRKHGYRNDVDYYVSGNSADGGVEELLYGHFDKSGATWKYDPQRAVISPSIRKFCSDKFCPLPVDITKVRHQKSGNLERSRLEVASTPYGQLFTLGGNAARFPRVAVDNDGICWLTWEEQGDIFLSSVQADKDRRQYIIEGDSSDSFDPQIALAGSGIWVFYLNDIDSYYRLYCRRLSDGHLSPEIPVSEKTVCDAITPAVTSDGKEKLAIAWSEWRANLKYPKYLTIDNEVMGEVKAMRYMPTTSEPGAVCAWYPSLAMDDKGNVRGAWNQHYPATFAAYSGNLEDEPVAIGDGDIGGYAAVIFDKMGTFWVFWETFLWERVYADIPQSIQAAYYDEGQNRFSLPVTLSDDTLTEYNQTPCVAVSPSGVMWVAWSGRASDGTPWGIYLVTRDGDHWSKPVRVSPRGENSRAPSMAISHDGILWIAWHSGRGGEMKIKILRYEAN